MQNHRILSLGSILAMLIIPVIGWFLVAQPQLAAAGEADAQRAAIAEQITATTAVVAQLKTDSEQLPDLMADLDELRGSIPADIDPSGYIDGLGALADLTGVSIVGLTVSDPQAYSPAKPEVDPDLVVVPEDGAEEGAGDGEAAPVVPVDDPAFVTNPLITAENFVAIPVSIEISGKYSALLNFVKGLQSRDRLFLVATLSTARENGSSNMTAAIGGFIYAIPTGIEGDPRPTSTMVKQMDAAEDAEDADEDESGETDDESTETPAPDPTETPAP
jgi:Tfp pilus assembly protein PilO